MKLIERLNNLKDRVTQYLDYVNNGPTFNDSLIRLSLLSKENELLKERIEIQKRTIKYLKEENRILESDKDNKVTEANYSPKNNQQYHTGKKYKGNLLNLDSKDEDTFFYE